MVVIWQVVTKSDILMVVSKPTNTPKSQYINSMHNVTWWPNYKTSLRISEDKFTLGAERHKFSIPMF